MAAQKTLLTAEQFYHEYAGRPGRYELVRGEVVEMTPPGGLHGKVALNIGSILRAFVREHDLGQVVVESGFVLRKRPATVRGPDVSFVAAEHLRNKAVPKTFFELAPDLAVEVVSPDDTAGELEEKVHEYLAAGAKQVWLFYPDSRRVHVYHDDGTARWHSEQDTLDGGDLLPGFSVRVREFFE